MEHHDSDKSLLNHFSLRLGFERNSSPRINSEDSNNGFGLRMSRGKYHVLARLLCERTRTELRHAPYKRDFLPAPCKHLN